jgi:hypothetical protein
MNRVSRVSFHACLRLALLACTAGCAVPATQVEVPTRSMHEALEQSREGHPAAPAPDSAGRRALRTPSPPGVPSPLLAAPDVRMAYLYDWIDPEGNQHFGGWVAIPLAGFDWILNDGSAAPLNPPRPAAPAQPGGTP